MCARAVASSTLPTGSDRAQILAKSPLQFGDRVPARRPPAESRRLCDHAVFDRYDIETSIVVSARVHRRGVKKEVFDLVDWQRRTFGKSWPGPSNPTDSTARSLGRSRQIHSCTPRPPRP